MTGAAIPLGRAPVAPIRAGSAAEETRRHPVVELPIFAGLGLLATLCWARLVAHAPAGRLTLALLVACAAAAAFVVIGRSGLRRPWSSVACLAIAVAALAGALLAVGIPGRLLLPAHWGELRANLSFGFSGVEQTRLPYRGPDEWLRLALLSVAPVAIALAAAIGFWPGRREYGRRIVALVVLLATYGIAVTLDSPPHELLVGVVVLLLTVAWLWAPRVASRRGAGAIVAVACAGALAVPVAAALDPAKPWWDYESWSLFGGERTVTFDWDHKYGPLDWPQKGTTLLQVQSEEPLYWKASVLDRFDGFTWQRARDSDIYAGPELYARQSIPGTDLAARHQGWLNQATFEVRALESPFVIGAGQVLATEGVEGGSLSADGTVRKFGSPIKAGDRYSVTAYVPDPTVDQLREAPRGYPLRLQGETLLGLPRPGAPSGGDGQLVLGSADPVDGETVAVWGHDGFNNSPALRRLALRSAYADVYRLANRLVANARTPYDGVIAIQRYLHRNYTYNTNVRRAAYPLESFLFDQKEGYCQQFAGSMALMLRMVGIPSRVVAGFAPGTLDSERNVYTVHDTDAHSWVEVYFRGIGWVTFDPTPAAAPAVSQSLNELAAFRGVDPAAVQGGGKVERRRGKPAGSTSPTTATEQDGGGLPWGPIGLVVLVAAVATACAYLVAAWRRHRAFARGDATEAQLAELVDALNRLGWGLPRHATLLAIERRFKSAGRPAVSRYAAGLRAHRFAPGGQPAPGSQARREVRRTLAGSGGLGRRFRGLAAIPLGGPRNGNGG